MCDIPQVTSLAASQWRLINFSTKLAWCYGNFASFEYAGFRMIPLFLFFLFLIILRTLVVDFDCVANVGDFNISVDNPQIRDTEELCTVLDK